MGRGQPGGWMSYLMHFGWRRRPARLGDRGERLAARFLAARGYRILHWKYRSGRAEADLIALSPDRATVVIVEVKTRVCDRVPEESIGPHKMRQLTQLARGLRRQWARRGRSVRIDAIVIIWPVGEPAEIRHYAALPWSGGESYAAPRIA